MGLVRDGQGRLGSKCTQDGVTVLFELCMRFEQLDRVVCSRDCIALRDFPECLHIIIIIIIIITSAIFRGFLSLISLLVTSH